METNGIDSFISKQVNHMGSRHTIRRYSIMLNELTKTMNEMEDKKRASVISDVAHLLRLIICGIKN